ncbi:HMG-box domain-containing protein [bacterium]|nr:HMG-box domain-containing protein [bacterium]
MTTTERILTTFTSKVEMEKEYTRSELGKMLTEVFKEIREGLKGEKKTRKKAKKEEGGEEKKKREPTKYNLYVRETMPVVKEKNPEMSRQDLMREVGRMWKETKEADEGKKE